MRFSETIIPGCFQVATEPQSDDRGGFARIWCAEEFKAAGLPAKLDQNSLSTNHAKGTLRGLHWQAAPHGESKVVSCPRGAVFDVALDLRPTSPAYLKWVGVELSSDNGQMLFIPAGVAHGFQTLSENSAVFYQISGPYAAQAARGVRFDDPVFGIAWPLAVAAISERDKNYADFVAEGA